MRMLNRCYLIVGFAAATAAAIGCCLAYGQGAKVQLSDEKVIIVWDAAHKRQHFIRRARFDTGAKDFGFIVPTPAVPELKLANEHAYSILEELIPDDQGFSLGCKKQTESTATPPAAGSVEVISTEKVGDYQATIVRATDGKAMNEWLK